jgi:polyferredoxin
MLGALRRRGPDALNITYRRKIRGRTIAYTGMITLVSALMLYQLATRQLLSLSAMHVRAPMFTTAHDGGVRDGYALRLANKWSDAHKFAISVEGLKNVSLKREQAAASPDGKLIVEFDPDANQEIDLYVTALDGPSTIIEFRATNIGSGEAAESNDHFFGP